MQYRLAYLTMYCMSARIHSRIVLFVVLCTGVFSLPTAQEHHSYDSNIDRDKNDDRRGLQIDWATQKWSPSPKPADRVGSWGIVTRLPTSVITPSPTKRPSTRPTPMPTTSPSRHPSFSPSVQPSGQPTTSPSAQPSEKPTTTPSLMPSNQPTSNPSASSSYTPSASPSSQPTNDPSVYPAASRVSIEAGTGSNNGVTIEAGTGSNNGVKFTLVGSVVVILIGALIVKRGCILGKDKAENEEEGGGEEEEDGLQNRTDMEEGRYNITYPLPPSAVVDTRIYKTKEHSGLPIHNLVSREQSNIMFPIHYG